MRHSFFIYIIVVFTTIISCRKDFFPEISNGSLEFSKDTLFLDTVFSGISSSTYNLKVYNKSNTTISIPSVKLELGENSMYRLNIDGKAGKTFSNIEILPKDSIYIFVEATINYSKVIDPIYTDAILFESETASQNVKLVTLVKDAHFLYPSKNAKGIIETIKINEGDYNESIEVQGFNLNNSTTFTNEKPYVIYGYCVVPEGKTLTIEAGSNLFFHSNSGLIISKNATLKIQGELNQKVRIEGDRLESKFSNIPGQWGTIWLQAGSKNNSITNTIIKNSSIGVIIDSISNSNTPTLHIKNTEIYDSSNYGILARGSSVLGENLVINNAGQSALACTAGGTYNFYHSTFSNFWNWSPRRTPCVIVNNYFIKTNSEEIQAKPLNEANFVNCIIDGANQIEFSIEKIDHPTFNFSFKNNLLKFNDVNNVYSTINEYNFNNTNYYENNIFNGKSNFKSINKNELIVGEKSDAIKKGALIGTVKVPLDILGKTRTQPSDIGAYEHIIFEK